MSRDNFFVTVGDVEVTGYQEDGTTVITNATDQASNSWETDQLDVDKLMADSEFMSDLDEAIRNYWSELYEGRMGI
jgi:hypothetical protein